MENPQKTLEKTPKKTSGRICTFYSYKGGVGRSMALANVAIVLARLGRTVLVADWDIEAPGLDRYFERPGVRVDRRTPGVVDFVTRFDKTDTQLWRQSVRRIPVRNGKEIHLIHAGLDDADYPERLRSIDWQELFSRGLGNSLEQWRNDIRASYDYVLIDSRTGLTDVGGICSILLPDYVIALFTSNDQSVDGTLDAMSRAKIAHARLPVDRSKLLIVPVPARDESNTEYEKAREWRYAYGQKLAPLIADWIPVGKDPVEVFDFLKIPHVPFWSFGEQLPVLTEDPRNPKTLAYSYSVIARLLDSGLDWSEVTGAGEQAIEAEVQQRVESEAREREAEAVRLKTEESLRASREKQYEEMKRIAYDRADDVRFRLARAQRRAQSLMLTLALISAALPIGWLVFVWKYLGYLPVSAIFTDGALLMVTTGTGVAVLCALALTTGSAISVNSRLRAHERALRELDATMAHFNLKTLNSFAPVDELITQLLQTIDTLDEAVPHLSNSGDRGKRADVDVTLANAPTSYRSSDMTSPVPSLRTDTPPPSSEMLMNSLTESDIVICFQPKGISRDWLREFMPMLSAWVSEQIGRDADISLVPVSSGEASEKIGALLDKTSALAIVVLTEGALRAPEIQRLLERSADQSGKTILLWLDRPASDGPLYRRLTRFPSHDFSDLAYVGEGFSRSERYLDFQDRVRDLARTVAADLGGSRLERA